MYIETTKEQLEGEISPALSNYVQDAIREDLPDGAIYMDHFIVQEISGKYYIMPGIRNARKNRYTVVSEEEINTFKGIFTGKEVSQKEISDKLLETFGNMV